MSDKVKRFSVYGFSIYGPSMFIDDPDGDQKLSVTAANARYQELEAAYRDLQAENAELVRQLDSNKGRTK